MIWIFVIGLVAAVALSAAFSGLETGVYSLERVRLQVRAAGGDRGSMRLLQLAQDPARTVCTILVVNNGVNYAVAACSGRIVHSLADPGIGDMQLELLNTLWVVPVLFVFGELVPKSLFLQHPTSLASRVWPLYRVANVVCAPLVRPLLALLSRLTGDEARPPLLARRGVVDVLTRGDEAGALTGTQRAIARRVLTLHGVPVRSRMVTVDQVVAVGADAGRDEVLAEAARTGRSRLLVRSPDGGFSGYVNALDAAFASNPADWELSGHVFAMPSVAADVPVLQAIETLQGARRPLAIVRDGTGPVGILSAADVVDALMERPSGFDS